MLSRDSSFIPLSVFLFFLFAIIPFLQTGRTIDPELTLRFVAISVFMVVFTVIMLAGKMKTISTGKEVRGIFMCLIALLVWTGISIFKSINTGDAFSEWLRLALMYSVFIVAYFLFQVSSNAITVLSRFVLIGNFIFGGYAIVQLVPQWSDYILQTPLHRSLVIPSSLANKNFFSEVLVLMLPALVYGIITERKWMKAIFILSLGLNLFFILINQTISAWIAIIVSLLFFLLISRLKKIKAPAEISSSKKIFISCAIIIAGGIVCYTYSKSPNFKILKERIIRTKEYIDHPELLSSYRVENNNSAFERFIIWRNSIKMIERHPVTGSGLNNWKLLYPEFGVGGTQYINSGFLNYEHPHNDYLLIWAEQGLPGLIIYLLLFILIIRYGLIKMNSATADEKRIILIFLCGIINFMILSFFSYPRSRIYSMIMLMITFAIVASTGEKSTEKSYSLRKIFIPVFLISLMAGIASWYRLNGEIHQRNIIAAQVNGNFDRVLRESDKAESWFYPLDGTSTPIVWYNGLALFYSKNIPAALENYEKAILINPNHLRTMNDLATSYEQTGKRDRAIYYYKKALAITPLFIEGNMNISAAYYNTGNYDSAYYYIDKIYSLPMSWTEGNNYKKFLSAILQAKVSIMAESVENAADSANLRHIIPLGDSLSRLYKLAKEQKKQFPDFVNAVMKGK